jgi:hypothetical protein
VRKKSKRLRGLECTRFPYVDFVVVCALKFDAADRQTELPYTIDLPRAKESARLLNNNWSRVVRFAIDSSCTSVPMCDLQNDLEGEGSFLGVAGEEGSVSIAAKVPRDMPIFFHYDPVSHNQYTLVRR